MKKIFSSVLAVILALVPFSAVAQVVGTTPGSRVVVYQNQNPDTNETNLQWRFERLARGTLLRDQLAQFVTGSGNPGGAWSNLNVAPVASSLFVTMAPGPTTNQPAGIYQVQPDDSSVLPNYSNCGGCPTPTESPLPADNTQVVVQALQTGTTSNLGPFTAPGSNCRAYVVESQVNTADTNANSTLFINPNNGLSTYYNAQQNRNDTVTYAVGSTTNDGPCTGASEVAAPSPDAGYFTVAVVVVPSGTTALTTGMITMFNGTNFNGSSFGKLTFGGNYLSSNSNLNSPSTLSTNSFSSCGTPSSGAQGLIINNAASPNAPSGNGHLVAADIDGNWYICGQTLTIFNQQSNSIPAQIVVDTPVNSGTSQVDTLYPAAGQKTWNMGGSCASGSWCTNGGNNIICAGVSATTGTLPNAAFISIAFTSTTGGDADAEAIIPEVAWNSGGGFAVYMYNAGPLALTHNFFYNFVCL